MLAVDIGNTQVKFGWFTADALSDVTRLPTRPELDTSQWQRLLTDTLPQSTIDACNAIVVGSVVPRVTGALCAALTALTGTAPRVVHSTQHTNLRISYDDPSKLGVDRLANAVAAYERDQGGVIVVDLGTATKFDCVSNSGEYLGGLIAAGVRMGVDALTANAAQLPAVSLEAPSRIIATNTVQAIQAAAVFGAAAMIDGLVPRLEVEMNAAPRGCRVVVTGGYAPLIAPFSKRADKVAPNLTLEGLRKMYELIQE